MSETPSRPPLPTTYDPSEVEPRRYQQWVDRGVFTADASSGKPPYTIVIPPPNVTGSLHMGHAFQHTLMDALTRRKRMQGYEALWLPGMDHAGIATQAVVERELAKEGTSRHDLGREAFVERVWQWKAEYGGRILGQMRRLGDGVDWSRQRFTMDEGLSRAVRTMFKRLYDDGLIYRAERIVNWSPPLRSAISDIEVEYKDVEGELVTIDYGPLQVSTTRVETMLGDTGVAVHPDDERYRHLVGTTIALPLTNREIPVVADSHVDPEFGTGAVKVTPAHDPNDFAIGQRHGLANLTVMDEDARIDLPGTPFHGLDRYEARRAVTEALRAEGRIVKEVRPYIHSVGHDSRSGAVIEPRLSLQWWVKVGPLAQHAGDAVRAGETWFSPEDMTSRYFDWVDDMHDWCISRQLWWGHRIPVWYGPDGEQVVPGDGEEPPEGWTQDTDVLDTWFSSALWPVSTLGWPDETQDLQRFYPTDVLVTGYDIIFFWVARMMMFCTHARPEVPFRTVALTGLVRDARGKKMSKSAGNVVDPLDWIDRYGADALRLTLARGANPGADVPVSEEWVVGARAFATKVWNATRFALMNGAVAGPLPTADRLTAPDRWILSRLAAVTGEVDGFYEAYEFGKVCDALQHFARDDLFDWYVELAKTPLRAGGDEAEATRAVLGHCLDVLLRLLHPVMPFVTEELWSGLTGFDVLATQAWPPSDTAAHDPAAEAEVRALQDVVTEVRKFRSEQGLPPKRKVPAVLVATDGRIPAYAEQIGALTDLEVTVAGEAPQGWPLLEAPGARVALDLSDAIDVEAERARLSRELDAAVKEEAQTSGKLGNASFVERAPAAVVDKTRARLEAARAEVARLRGLLDALPPAAA